MHTQTFPHTLRRSSRVPAVVPILVTSLNGTHFSEVCETMVVNAHGCSIRSRVKLETGVPLHFHSRDGRETTARVVSCQPIGSDAHTWMLGATLDRPENFWGLRNCPQDWVHTNTGDEASDLVLEDPEVQLYAGGNYNVLAESVSALRAEIAAMKEKLARAEAQRSRFDVSLSSIPPELEQQLEVRLRQELSPRVMDEARQQSASLLAQAQANIEQTTGKAYEDFVHRAGEELQVVEQRAQEISAHIYERLRERLGVGMAEFQQRLEDGGGRLNKLSEELLEFLQRSLNQEYDARRAEMEKLHAAVAAESSRLREQVEYLDGRISKLDESVRNLETGLDQRLNQMAADTIKNTRSEIERATETLLTELTARGSQALGNQLDEACGNMRIHQKGIVASVSESLNFQSSNALQEFERSMEELAQFSVERWRIKLMNGLNAVVAHLGEEFQLESKPESN